MKKANEKTAKNLTPNDVLSLIIAEKDVEIANLKTTSDSSDVNLYASSIRTAKRKHSEVNNENDQEMNQNHKVLKISTFVLDNQIANCK